MFWGSCSKIWTGQFHLEASLSGILWWLWVWELWERKRRSMKSLPLSPSTAISRPLKLPKEIWSWNYSCWSSVAFLRSNLECMAPNFWIRLWSMQLERSTSLAYRPSSCNIAKVCDQSVWRDWQCPTVPRASWHRFIYSARHGQADDW